MAVTASIDDLFRQKSLNEIHDVLRQTRQQVEAKKQELRELVGDHYRSMLESTDHIRAMSECAAKVSAGADRIEGLIASMRELAANPPTVAAGSRMFNAAAKQTEDPEYRVGQRVMALVEVPETVRGHLACHEFSRAARAALVDASALQEEINGLLSDEGRAGEEGAKVKGGFDLPALVEQQEAALRGLPRQIASSCVDAFGVAALERTSAAEAFAVYLLLRPSAQPAPLLALFLRRRAELLRGLLDARGGSSSGGLHDGKGCGARLAAAAMAFEGTIVLGSGICADGATAGEAALLKETLEATVEGWPEASAAEERAAVRGAAPSALGPGALRRRAAALASALRAGGALGAELARLGQPFVEEFAPEDASATASGGAARSLSERFGRLVATAPNGELGSCAALGEVLKTSTEKVQRYRSALARGFVGDWPQLWRSACLRFRPGRATPADALAVLTSSVEAACAEVVRERAADLRLELVSAAEESLDEAVDSSGAGEAGPEAQSREEVLEMQRQSRIRVACFNEQLGEVVSDLAHVKTGGVVPVAITAALLGAVGANLAKACEKVRLPPASPAWPLGGGGKVQDGGAAASKSASLVSMQRSAARAATAFDALLSAVVEEKLADDPARSHLHDLLSSAVSSGDPGLVSQARVIEESIRQHSTAAYCVWARLAVVPQEGYSALDSFWRLSDDEVPHVCGWGNAKFPQKGAGDAVAKAVPVPIQASSFIFERLTLGARRAMEVSSGVNGMPQALVMAVKVALSETFAAAYETQQVNLDKLKKSGMNHLLQWLFDLNFLRITLSAGPVSGPGARPAAQAPVSPASTGNAAYEALLRILDRAESTTLSDPVDRLLYQEVLKTSVKSQVQGVKILLAPFFLHNPLYGFLFQSQSTLDRPASGSLGAVAGTGFGGTEGDGFELQATFVPPLRPAAPRFLLLPVANASTLVHTSSAELDARLGLSADSAERAAARAAASNAAAGSGAVSSLMQQVGSGLGSLGLGKAAWPLGSNWTSSWSGGTGAAGARPPEAV